MIEIIRKLRKGNIINETKRIYWLELRILLSMISRQ